MIIRRSLVILAALLAVLVFGVVVFARSVEPKIKGASTDSFMASLATIRSRLPAAERMEFDEAVATLMASQGGRTAVNAVSEGEASGDLRSRLDGKSAKEVCALAASFRVKVKEQAAAMAKRLREQIDSLAQEIAPLVQLRDDDAAVVRELAKITISNASLSQREWNPKIGKIITVHLTIRNNSERAVSRILMTGTIASEGRAAPWLVADISWEFKVELKPGNQETLHLNPGSFNGQPRLLVTPDMRLSVSIKELTGPDGTRIARPIFSDEQRTLLSELESEITDAQKRLAALVF
jgi:hypothetical protein